MKLSIITINYNNLQGLKKTFDSVRCQTWNDYEWIIIDGGSTDGSKEFIEHNSRYFAFCCSEKDKGVYNAQNKGIQYAKGEYLLFLNSGDCLAYSTTFETVFGKERNADIIYGYMMRKTLNGIPHNIPSMKKNIYWNDFYFDTLPHQSSYIKRSLFIKYGRYDESYSRLADWKWFANVISGKKATIEFIPEKLSIYECGGISEDENWKEELYRLRHEFFPAYISEEDLDGLRDLHSIAEYKVMFLCYKVIRKLVRAYNKYKLRKDIKHA